MENNFTRPFKFINPEWYKTVEGESCIKQLCINGNYNTRKQFGLLERPNVSPGTPEIVYHIGIIGKAGSGKTELVSILSGKPNQRDGYSETAGIHFWEAGESCSKRYSYIPTACIDKTDSMAVVVNKADRASFEYAENKLEMLSYESVSTMIFVMDTDQDVQVFDNDLKHLAHKKKIPLFYLPPCQLETQHLAPFFDSLCEFLYSTQKDIGLPLSPVTD